MNSVQELFKNYTLKTPRWSLDGKQMWARIVDLYDADTITLILPLDFGFYKFSCRIYGIDTSEINSKNEDAKLLANKAKLRMLQLCGIPNIDLTKTYSRKDIQKILEDNIYCVQIKCKDWDKYGRLLAHVYRDNIELANILIEEKLAYAYYGGTKLSENEQINTLS
jgi:endonuclease YncB( thermonuclease family)